MDALNLLEQAREAGLDVHADGEKLVVRGPKKAELLARELLDHKAEVLPLLAVQAAPQATQLPAVTDEPPVDSEPPAEVLDAETAGRLEAMLPQVPARGVIPFLVARPAVPPSPVTCLSCGDPLADERLCRCPPCARAAWLAIHAVREGLRLPDLLGGER
jgi:hypothetical protein